jgi:O-antigen ligase
MVHLSTVPAFRADSTGLTGMNKYLLRAPWQSTVRKNICHVLFYLVRNRILARQFNASKIFDSAPFWVLAIFILLTFLTGGGARDDIQSLAILRPVSALALGFALWGASFAHFQAFRFLTTFAALLILLVILHLAPLPPSLWAALPGRELIADIDKAAGLGAVWRPLSLAPSQTSNALYSLIGPLAMFVMLICLTREQRFAVLRLLLLIGLFSGGIGLLQAVGPTDGPLYFYNITNGSAAVGLFANRNHQAVLLACLFPMLAVYASTGALSIEQARFRRLIAIGAGLLLVPLLLVTGSRAGLIVGVVGLASAAMLYQTQEFAASPKRKVHRFNPKYIYGGVGIFGLTAITLLMSRAQALERLLAGDNEQDLRFVIWGPIMEIAGKYFPFGSGIGSFVEAYQVDEDFSQLSPEYLNHAHNDWIEMIVTGGLPAIMLVCLALMAWGWQVNRLLRQSGASRRGLLYGRLGAVIIFIVALGSVSDYPLRVPSIAVLFVIAAVWMADAFCEPAAPQASQARRVD